MKIIISLMLLSILVLSGCGTSVSHGVECSNSNPIIGNIPPCYDVIDCVDSCQQVEGLFIDTLYYNGVIECLCGFEKGIMNIN